MNRTPPPAVAEMRPAAPRRAWNEPPAEALAPRSWDELEPLGPLLAQGVVTFGVGVALVLLAVLLLPASFAAWSLILPALLGFIAFLRWDHPALIVAGLVAVAACAVSLFAYGHYAGQGSGDAVVIESIAEVPAQSEAMRFTFTNAHAARGLTGSAQPPDARPGAARIYHVMPLVPPRWQREQPVPVWAACVAATGAECLREIDDMGGMARVRAADLDHYRAAVADAEKNHGLKSVADAPILEPATGPAETSLLYLLAAIAAPLLGLALWMLGMLGWRAWQVRQQADPSAA